MLGMFLYFGPGFSTKSWLTNEQYHDSYIPFVAFSSTFRCVAMSWPALVVGHRGSGKTSIVQGLAAAVGARLTEVAMTPSVDVTELLGCFEQVRLSWLWYHVA